MITIHNLNEIDKLAQILVKYLNAKDLILLNSDLGAGKTTLTQFVGKALSIKRTINSPTFSIVKPYTGPSIRLHHMGCYRLGGEGDDLSFDEYFEDNAIIVIEWSKFIRDFLPPNHLTINISVKDVSERQVSIETHGQHYTLVKEAILNELSSN